MLSISRNYITYILRPKHYFIFVFFRRKLKVKKGRKYGTVLKIAVDTTDIIENRRKL